MATELAAAQARDEAVRALTAEASREWKGSWNKIYNNVFFEKHYIRSLKSYHLMSTKMDTKVKHPYRRLLLYRRLFFASCTQIVLLLHSTSHRSKGGTSTAAIVKASPTKIRTRDAGVHNRRRSSNLSPQVELQRIRKANRTSAKRHRDRARSEVARMACRLTELNAKNAALRQIFMEHIAQLQGLKLAICCQRGWTI